MWKGLEGIAEDFMHVLAQTMCIAGETFFPGQCLNICVRLARIIFSYFLRVPEIISISCSDLHMYYIFHM
jgi:hypothetical protein